MQKWTSAREPNTRDECWILTHPPVFTLGQSAKDSKPLTNPDKIPVIASDRGGKITYHGPGQIIVYLLLDISRLSINVKELVNKSEDLIMQLLQLYQLHPQRRPDMPGVYINEYKIAALGYKIKKGCSYHGISINHGMDLGQFSWIDVCGYQGLEVTDMRSLGIKATESEVIAKLIELIPKILYNSVK